MSKNTITDTGYHSANNIHKIIVNFEDDKSRKHIFVRLGIESQEIKIYDNLPILSDRPTRHSDQEGSELNKVDQDSRSRNQNSLLSSLKFPNQAERIDIESVTDQFPPFHFNLCFSWNSSQLPKDHDNLSSTIEETALLSLISSYNQPMIFHKDDQRKKSNKLSKIRSSLSYLICEVLADINEEDKNGDPKILIDARQENREATTLRREGSREQIEIEPNNLLKDLINSRHTGQYLATSISGIQLDLNNRIRDVIHVCFFNLRYKDLIVDDLRMAEKDYNNNTTESHQFYSIFEEINRIQELDQEFNKTMPKDFGDVYRNNLS